MTNFNSLFNKINKNNGNGLEDIIDDIIISPFLSGQVMIYKENIICDKYFDVIFNFCIKNNTRDDILDYIIDNLYENKTLDNIMFYSVFYNRLDIFKIMLTRDINIKSINNYNQMLSDEMLDLLSNDIRY